MDEEIYLSDLFAPVFAKWKLVLAFTLIGAVIGLVTTVRNPRSYESTATIFIQQSSPASSLRTSLALPISGSLGGNSVAYYTTVLQSETLLRRAVERLGLLRDPAFTKGKKVDLRQAAGILKRRTAIRDNKNGSIEISVKWADPDFAARVANGVLDCLGDTVSRNSTRKESYIGRKLAETTGQLDEAQDRLLAFQKKSGVPVIEEEGKRLMQSLSRLDAELLSLDVSLLEIRSNLGNAGDLDTLVEQEIRKRGMESGRDYVVKQRDDLLDRLNTLPDVASTYLKLERDVTVLGKTFELLTERYQLARIEQQGEGGEYQVIDRARPPDMPLARGTVTKTAMSGFTGFLLAVVAVSAAALGRKRRKGLR
jgi:uncharacterized protein involved in exopolysaccharide biosynthesis